MTVRSVILEQITRVGEQQRRKLAPLTDNLPLLDSGLDSLCLAIIVAGLDDELGLDPLSASDDVEFPVTLGEFIKLYENAAA
jgi:hypothetical protein